MNYANTDIYYKTGYWFKCQMEFLWPILAEIELICQQLAVPQLNGVHPNPEVPDRMAGGSRGGLAMGQKDGQGRS